MHDHPAIIFTALLLFIFGLFSHLTDRTPFTGPMFFVAMGLLFGPIGLNTFELDITGEMLKLVAEITLIVVLFIDSSMIRYTRLIDTLSGIPTRLLLIGLPISMLLGFTIAWIMFPGINIWLIAIMALILSPTDAALGQAVIKSAKVPERIRQSISIESGLNDGIALPPILVCLAVLVEGSQVIDFSGRWVFFMAKQLTIGPVIGALVGLVAGTLIEKASQKNWIEPTFQQLSALPIALLSYACAEYFLGNGFIAAFFCGLFFNVKSEIVRHRIHEFGEAQGQMLILCIFLIFGLVMVPIAMPFWDFKVLIYAILSLTVIRMVPVAISMIGSGLDRFTIGFIGWFGPRGIASILYLLIVTTEIGFVGYETALSTIVLTILLSTFLHGVSAVPLSNAIKAAQK